MVGPNESFNYSTPDRDVSGGRKIQSKGSGNTKGVNLLRLSRIAKLNLQRENEKENYWGPLPNNSENDTDVKIENTDMELDFNENNDDDSPDEPEMVTPGCTVDHISSISDQEEVSPVVNTPITDDSRRTDYELSLNYAEVPATPPSASLEDEKSIDNSDGGDDSDSSKSAPNLSTVLWHSSDLLVRPVMPSKKSDKGSKVLHSLPFEAIPTSDFVKIAKDYCNTDAANILTNGQIMPVLVKMLRQSKASALRVQLASLLGLFIRHSTFINDDLANSGMLGSLNEGLMDRQVKVRRFSMAALGELLFYISTQNDQSKANHPLESPSKESKTSSGSQETMIDDIQQLSVENDMRVCGFTPGRGARVYSSHVLSAPSVLIKLVESPFQWCSSPRGRTFDEVSELSRLSGSLVLSLEQQDGSNVMSYKFVDRLVRRWVFVCSNVLEAFLMGCALLFGIIGDLIVDYSTMVWWKTDESWWVVSSVNEGWTMLNVIWGGNWEWCSSPRGRTFDEVSELSRLSGSLVLSLEQQDGSNVMSYKVDWNRFVPRKVNICIWRVVNDWLPTRANLLLRGLTISSSVCPLEIWSWRNRFVHADLVSLSSIRNEDIFTPAQLFSLLGISSRGIRSSIDWALGSLIRFLSYSEGYFLLVDLLAMADNGSDDTKDQISPSLEIANKLTMIHQSKNWQEVEETLIFSQRHKFWETQPVGQFKYLRMIYGNGKTKSVVIGSLNFVDGTPTFSTVTFDIFSLLYQASSSGLSVWLRFFRCSFDAFQDTLYPHSSSQFYRECDVTRTIDFIFGNAAVVFQNCKIMPHQPLKNQFVTITAQGKKGPNQNTGISIQKCDISPFDALTSLTYLGRPWKEFSTTVIMQSTIVLHVERYLAEAFEVRVRHNDIIRQVECACIDDV
ncbi:serine/threonine-protein kinase RUNKEL [Tanacetum coccineum]|uniref:Serine/threonine-protein kinase RUNKEL n=1 Tax=Tanacetum coccineum TaxID=301880 RepID=A0ABQ4ZRG0_9ASTR